MTVTLDALGSHQFNNSPVTAISYTGITVGSGTNNALVFFLWWTLTGNPTSITAVWDSVGANQNMVNMIGTGATTTARSRMYCLLSPAAGNKTLSISWTNATGFGCAAASFNGVNQTSNAAAFINGLGQNFAAATSASQSVNGSPGDMALGMTANNGATVTPSFPSNVVYNGTIAGAATIAESEYNPVPSGASSTTFNWGLASSQAGSTACLNVVWDGTTGGPPAGGAGQLAGIIGMGSAEW